MVFTTGDLGGLLRFFRPDDHLRGTDILFVANSKLAMVVKAPCEELSLLISVERGMAATEDIYGLFGANLLNLAGLIVLAF